jgi:hypothetical protein
MADAEFDLDRFKTRRSKEELLARAAATLKGAAIKRGRRRKPFQAQWVRFPLSWLVALEQTKSASAIKLALRILFAEFHRQHTRSGIVLSAAMSGMPNATRVDATRELVRLGLIEVEQFGRGAPRVVRVNAGQPDHGQP